MDVIGVIPARFEATRFKGKVLAKLCGKPVIQHVYENAKKSGLLDDIIVATDDNRVFAVVNDFGGKACFTSQYHLTGSDRIVEVVGPIDVKVVVNIQGDEPFLHPSMIDNVIMPLLEGKNVDMATLKYRMVEERELNDSNVVKVVTDKDGFALYFSRSLIPFPKTEDRIADGQFFKHIGIYAYTKDFLLTFTRLPRSNLERIEGLEQLRALENGYRIKVVETLHKTISIDTPEDLKLAVLELQEKTYQTSN